MPKISVSQQIERLEDRMQKGFADLSRIFSEKIESRFDEMGRMVKAGFDHVDERFEQVDERFEKVDERFDRLDLQIGSINRRLEQAVFESEFHELDGRVKVLEHRAGISRK